MHRQWLHRTLIVVTIFIWICLIAYLHLEKRATKYCYLMPEFMGGHCDAKLKPLEDVLIAAYKPPANRSIFFHNARIESHEFSTWKAVKLKARDACAIESAALHNPNSSVFVLFTDADYYALKPNSLVKALVSYSNVHLRSLNLWTYINGSAITEWNLNGTLLQEHFVSYEVTDFLRYLTLLRFGGTYLEQNTITVRSLEDLPQNYVGAESNKNLGASVLNLAAAGIGHEVAQRCLQNFVDTYNEYDYGNNGPAAIITKVMQEICGEENIHLMVKRQSCKGIRIYDRSAFYSLSWKDWIELFLNVHNQDLLKRLENSYAVHLWSELSSDLKTVNGSPLMKIAQKNCPKTFAIAQQEF